MWEWLDRVAPLLLDASLAAAVLTSVFIAILLVNRQPARRVALARTAILGVLAIPLLTVVAPWPRFHVDYSHIASPPPPRQIVVRRSPTNGAPVDDVRKLDRGAIAMIPIGDDDDVSGPWIRLATVARRPLRFLVVLYLTIVGLGVAWATLGLLGIWWLIRRSTPPSAQTLRVFEPLLSEAGYDRRAGRPPRLRVSDRAVRPVVAALVHPTILIPRQFDRACLKGGESPSPQWQALLRLCLLHELAHAGRRDATFQLVGSLAQAIWFFLPQLWWIRAQLRIDQEYLADHVACRLYGAPTQYATSLLDLAESHSASTPATAPTTMAAANHAPAKQVSTDEAGASSLGQRLLMLLHCPYRLEPSAPRAWLWGLRLAGVLATCVLANVSVRMPGRAYGSPPGLAPSIEGVFLAGMNRFQVSELIMDPSSPVDTARADSYILPYQLPAHFSMTLDVLASQTELSQIRLMDRPLAQTDSWATRLGATVQARHASRTETADPDDRELWHTVRIKRDDQGMSLSIDHHALPSPEKPSSSLIKVEPEFGHPVLLRNLIVTPAL